MDTVLLKYSTLANKIIAKSMPQRKFKSHIMIEIFNHTSLELDHITIKHASIEIQIIYKERLDQVKGDSIRPYLKLDLVQERAFRFLDGGSHKLLGHPSLYKQIKKKLQGSCKAELLVSKTI